MTSFYKLSLLATLYFSQGLPYGFFTQCLPVLMRQQGLSLPEIGLSTLLTLPWALKFLWSPLVDRYGNPAWGRYRSWILPLQGLAVILLTSLAFLDPHTQMRGLMFAVMLANLLAATQDIATDALAVEMLVEEERGPGNGIQVAGYRVGMVVGGGVMLIFLDQLGWFATFQTMAVLLAVATIPILMHRERAPTVSAPEGHSRILSFIQRPGVTDWLLMLAIYKFSEAMGSAMIRPFFVDHGIQLTEIGWILGTYGFTAGLAGALVGGWGVSALGRRRALAMFGTLQVVGVAAYAALASGPLSPGMVVGACILEHFTSGTATASLFTLMMDICREESAATDYTCQASLVVISTSLAGSISGYSCQALGYARHFALATVLCGAGLVLCLICLRRATRAKLFVQD